MFLGMSGERRQCDTPLDKLVEQATFDLGRRMPKPQFHATCISLVQMAHESLFGVAASELLRSELDSAAQLVSQSILLETNEAARIRLLDSLITAGAPPSFWIEFTHTMARGGMSDAMMFRRVVGKISPSIMRPIIASLINKTTTSAGRYTVLTSSLASRRSFSVEWLESCWGDKDPLVSIVALQLLGLRKEKPDRVEGLLLTKSKLPLRLARMRTLIDVALPDEAVAAHCRRRLKSSRTHFQELMLLPELIKQTGAADWTLMDALRLVHHKKWAVQAKGLELLSHCRQRKAVRELIPFASHSRLLLSHAARLSLRSLTGKQLGEDPKAWEDWLDSQPREWTPRSKEKTAETPCEYGTSFYGMRIQSNRVIFVCDTSGSMSGGRIESLKEQIAVALKGLRADAAFNLIFFSSIVHAHFSSLVRAHKTTIKRAVGTTRKRQAHGGTNLYGGLIRAIKTHDVDTIILLSDGAPSAGKIVSTTNILKAVQQANIRKGIHIHTIYLAGPFAMAPGSNTCSRFLQDLAQQNSGTFKMITD